MESYRQHTTAVRTRFMHTHAFSFKCRSSRLFFQGLGLNPYCGLKHILDLKPKGLKDHCYTSKYLKTVFISIVVVLNYSRPNSFQKTYDDQDRESVLIGSKSESSSGIQKGRLFARCDREIQK